MQIAFQILPYQYNPQYLKGRFGNTFKLNGLMCLVC